MHCYTPPRLPQQQKQRPSQLIPTSSPHVKTQPDKDPEQHSRPERRTGRNASTRAFLSAELRRSSVSCWDSARRVQNRDLDRVCVRGYPRIGLRIWSGKRPSGFSSQRLLLLFCPFSHATAAPPHGPIAQTQHTE